jgi:hypothetical protein
MLEEVLPIRLLLSMHSFSQVFISYLDVCTPRPNGSLPSPLLLKRLRYTYGPEQTSEGRMADKEAQDGRDMIDENELAKIGYKQELKRDLSLLQVY